MKYPIDEPDWGYDDDERYRHPATLYLKLFFLAVGAIFSVALIAWLIGPAGAQTKCRTVGSLIAKIEAAGNKYEARIETSHENHYRVYFKYANNESFIAVVFRRSDGCGIKDKDTGLPFEVYPGWEKNKAIYQALPKLDLDNLPKSKKPTQLL